MIKIMRAKKYKRFLGIIGVMLTLCLVAAGCAEGVAETETTSSQAPKPASVVASPRSNTIGAVTGTKRGWHRKAEEPLTDVVPVSVDSAAKSATIMIYMNGSDLETYGGAASADISEILDSGIGDKVNVVIQTMGTKKWQDYNISSNTAQTYCVKDGKLVKVRDNLGQLDCTSPDTLSEFVGYCKNNYSAERYMFIFWDHGGGPVIGFGTDEWQDESASLTISEMSSAFSQHPDVKFDIIGMDCCIMANLETCYALSPYCNYALLSEDFESGLGWSYSKWMKSFEENPAIATPMLGKTIVDGIINENDTDPAGASACISLFNESTIKDLFDAWKAYGYKNKEAMLK